ncbi:MAG: methyltransferase family protein [Terriglobia bacterium]
MPISFSAWAARWRVPLGFAFAVAYLVVTQPTSRLLQAGAIVALAGLLLRALAAGHLEKNLNLSISGPFRYSRHPLYLGSFILGLGFMIAGASWILGIVFVVLFVVVYTPAMRLEEGFLRQKFGADYDAYARRVPLFSPLPGKRGGRPGSFAWSRYRKNREYEAAAGYVAVLVFLVIKLLLR